MLNFDFLEILCYNLYMLKNIIKGGIDMKLMDRIRDFFSESKNTRLCATTNK